MTHNGFPHVGSGTSDDGTNSVSLSAIEDAMGWPRGYIQNLRKTNPRLAQQIISSLGVDSIEAFGKPPVPVVTGDKVVDRLIDRYGADNVTITATGDLLYFDENGTPTQIDGYVKIAKDATGGDGLGYANLALAREKFEYDRQQDAQKTAEDRRQFEKTYARDIRRDAVA